MNQLMQMDMGTGAAMGTRTPPPVITTIALDDADEGVSYSDTLAATGIVTAWSITAGALPDGLSLNAGTGEISGTPTAAGTVNITVRATGPGGYDEQELTLTVNAPAFDPYSYTSMNLNFGYRAGDVTLESTDRIQKVANTGDGAVCVAQTTGSSGRPTWSADGGNGKPCAIFDGSDDWLKLRNSGDSADSTLDALINNDAGWILNVVDCSAADVATDSASPESNDPVFIDHGSYVLMTLRDTAGAGTLYCSNWDGGYQTRSASVTLGQVNVLVWKHTGGNLTANVNGSETATVASGTTDLLTQLPRWFSSSAGNFLAGKHYHGMADDVVPVDEADIIAGMGDYY